MVQQPNGSGLRDPANFYRGRRRVSLALLVFVVVIGLPIIGVPRLRNRLSERVLALKSAWAGEIEPATRDVGAANDPFPAELERPEPIVPQPPKLPDLGRVFTMPPSSPATRSRRVPETAREIQPDTADEALGSAGKSAPGKPSPTAAPEPKYQQGIAEQEAYNILLSSNSTVAGLVKGSDPSLKFKSWDALNRGNDVFWVRLRFEAEGDPAAEYIWQVKLQTKEVTPLSHNARSL